MVQCPECASLRVWKDGVRQTIYGDVQRFLCRDCGFRFSDVSDVSKLLYTPTSIDSTYQIGATRKAHGLVKNLVEETVEPLKEGPAGATTLDQATIKGLLVQFAAYLEKEAHATHTYLKRLTQLVRCGANILDPEHVKTVIAKQPWKNGTKLLTVYAYDAFTKMQKIQWTPPEYKQEEIIPFIPDETELDQLIAACRSKRMATFLQTLKETYADPSEALRIRWIDIAGNTITINYPVKGHRPRKLEVSQRLLAMLNNLPKTSERIFPVHYQTMASIYWKTRQRIAQKLQNPRLLKIAFNTFRHWGGTTIAHYTNGNVLTVMKLLGHKNVQNSMKYIGMINFKDDEFEVVTATTVDEAKTILAAGFNYITEKNGIMLFRKPKRYKVKAE